MRRMTLIECAMSLLFAATALAGPHWTERYNVVWTTPSKDAAGSMPLGNGEAGLNLWVEENGDLLFYIGRSDSLSEISRLLKVGQVRVSLSPNPFVAGAPFRQELKLSDGVCEITAGEGGKKVTLRVFVDSDRPVVHVTGQSASPLTVKARAECWRTQRRALVKGDEQGSAWTLRDAPFELYESGDVFPAGLEGAAAWYHRNEESVAFPSTIKHQSLESVADQAHDPLWHRTFGGWLTGAEFKPVDGHSIQTIAPGRSFALRVAVPCGQTPTAQAWMDEAKQLAAEAADAHAALGRTTAWWREFWDRSWVITDAGVGQRVGGEQHPLRIGYDSNKQNPFPGAIGRTAVFSRPLPPEAIARLAAAAHDQTTPLQDGLLAAGDGTPREIPNDKLNFKRGFSLEAWIKPDRTEPGRIFDKITAGGSDGFLFDTHPGDTLRLIVGSKVLTAPARTIPADGWHHVAATFDSATGAASIYLDGKLLAGQSGDDVSPIARGYTLQRYMQACGGRGAYPIKFNGGIFTVEPKALGRPHNPDWRAWGDPHWFQNVRHMYHPMLASGDFEMMGPFFRLYEAARPLCEARARLYYGAEGCYFPETMTVWGAYANGDYGWNRGDHPPGDILCNYWRYAWNQGPELVGLMLDYWDYTRDEAFLRQQALPMAVSVLKYFDTRFKKDEKGTIVLDPTQSVETFWWDVVNDMPGVAGLNDITARLCALPEKLIAAQDRVFFAKMKAACPAVPVEQGRLAPAQKYKDQRSNCENPELYAVWPFRLYGLGKPGLEEARAAYAHRANHLDTGWGYDGNCAALLGLTGEAARILQVKCANSNPAYRWPATWGPNFDWLPDQNHGGNLLNTTDLMLLQSEGEKIRLLPAWPKDWDVSFKLHAPGNTTVECVYRGGKVEKLTVTPSLRASDVIQPGSDTAEERRQP
jgi:hypothetical protein